MLSPLRPGGASVAVAAQRGGKVVAEAASGAKVDVAKSGAKTPKHLEKIVNPAQAPIIPKDWVSRPGKKGGEIFFPLGTDPAKGEHIRIMPPGSSPVPELNENGYWRWQNAGGQAMDPATGKPGKGMGDTHIPLPLDSTPPVRR
jgi:filamentous hemagglutinin